MINDKVQEATQKLLAMWESGKLPEKVALTMIARQQGDRPSDNWSLANQILMIANDTEDARGFKQWKEVGRSVKKGAKAIYILGPIVRTITVEDEETGEKSKKHLITGFKTIPVFRIEDTEGEPLEHTETSLAPVVLPPLMNVAEKWGIQVHYKSGRGNFYGKYLINRDEIILCSHDEITFFHELAHAAHNRIRPLKGGQDPFQEVVAETSGAILCLMYGYKGFVADARNYVAHCAKVKPEEATKAVMKALSDIEKVITLILTTAEEAEKGLEAKQA